ncbi:MAG: hypothetical protein PF447_01635, partial [Spirochaetaceae bacterium]|nr:hypothetical protein [Spirochaetaceae bacterium]
SCKGEGIFYTLRAEEEIANSAFPDGAIIESIFPVVSDLDDPEYLVISGVSIWYKDISSDSAWIQLPRPSGIDDTSGALTSVVEHYDGTGSAIYASYYDSDSSSSSIYSYKLPDEGWISRGVNLPDSGNYYLFSDPTDYTNIYVNQRLYGEESTNTDTQLYYFNTSGNLNFSAVTAIELDAPVIDMAYDGTSYWMISSNLNIFQGNKLYQSSGSLDSFTEVEFITADSTTFGEDVALTSLGIIETEASGTLLLVGADDEDSGGFLYSSTDLGTIWTSAKMSGGQIPSSFCDLDPTNDSGIDDLIFMGNRDILSDNRYDGAVYYEIDYTDTSALKISGNTIADQSVYDSAELRNEMIYSAYKLYNDNTDLTQGYVLYVGSTGGLWALKSSNLEWSLQ